MSFKRVFTCFIIISLLLTGCSSSYDDNENIISETESYDINATSNNSATDSNDDVSSSFFDYVDLKDATANSYYGKLHVNGKFLSDKNNKPVQLKGISTHGIAWFPQYINKNTFKTLKEDWNINVIRLSMYTEENGGYCSSDDKQKEYLKSLIYKGIDAAKELNMYVIVDWHILKDKNPLTNVDEAIKFFDEVSSKYGNDPHILYEICNEPNGDTSWEDIKSYSNKVIPAIRDKAPDSIIIVGTPNWSQDVDIASESPITNYKNIMYSLHFYADTHKDDLRNKMDKAIKNGLPVFVTEYGICDSSGNGKVNIPEANKWIDALNKNKISYVAWNLSNKDESASLLNHLTEKTSNFSNSDLSPSGEWIKYMLTKNYTKGENKDYVDEDDSSDADSKEEIASENNSTENSSDNSSTDNNSEDIASNTDNDGGNTSNSNNSNNNSSNSNSNNNSNSSSNSNNANSSNSSKPPTTHNNNSSNSSSGNNSNNSNSSSNSSSGNNNSSSNSNNSGNSNSAPSFESDLVASISASSNLSTSINVDSSWEEGGKMCYLYRISITNPTSSVINDWTINLSLKNNIELRSFWNASATASGNTITLTSLHYNKTINPNSSVGDIGFIIKSQ